MTAHLFVAQCSCGRRTRGALIRLRPWIAVHEGKCTGAVLIG